MQAAAVMEAVDNSAMAEELPCLPDEMLLKIFGYLDMRELLRVVRPVCRRWRSLVLLQPELWRDRVVGDWNLALMVLRLAPCLRELELSCDNGLTRYPELLVNTRCDIQMLSFCMHDQKGNDVDLAALIIQNQVLRGNLRSLDLFGLRYNRPVHTPRSFLVLLRLVCGIEGLSSLEITLDGQDFSAPMTATPHSLPDALTPASLETLSCPSWMPEQHVQFLLQSHAAMLEVVHLPLQSRRNRLPLPPLLAAVANLRELQCPPLESMELLLTCPHLRSLTLLLDSWHPGPPSGAAIIGTKDFLRGAVHLDTLSLNIMHPSWSGVTGGPGGLPGLFVELFTALGSSGCAALTSAFVFYSDDLDKIPPPPLPVSLAFAAALNRLPRLQNLTSFPFRATREFLRELHVPSLRLLNPLLLPEQTGCRHSWALLPEVRHLLLRSPGLHIQVPNNNYESCQEVCQALGWTTDSWIRLAGHPAGHRHCQDKQHTRQSSFVTYHELL